MAVGVSCRERDSRTRGHALADGQLESSLIHSQSRTVGRGERRMKVKKKSKRMRPEKKETITDQRANRRLDGWHSAAPAQNARPRNAAAATNLRFAPVGIGRTVPMAGANLPMSALKRTASMNVAPVGHFLFDFTHRRAEREPHTQRRARARRH
jgi:hypothetical protein